MYLNGGKKRTTLRELVAKEQVFAPCVWDCMSAGVARAAGCKAILLSGAAVQGAYCGVSDICVQTADEMVEMTRRICQTNPLPLIIDAEDGFGQGPMYTYRTIYRLAEAGAMAFTLEDTTPFRGIVRLLKNNKTAEAVVPVDEWLAKLKAAKEAVKGTDCMIIARTEARYSLGFDEAIERCLRAIDIIGDENMTTIIGINPLPDTDEVGIENCMKVAERVPGWKMYPDVASKNGVSEVNLEDIYKLGFNLVTCHCLEKAAIMSMYDFAKHNIANNNTVYSDTTFIGDIPRAGHRAKLDLYNTDGWFEPEKEGYGYNK